MTWKGEEEMTDFTKQNSGEGSSAAMARRWGRPPGWFVRHFSRSPFTVLLMAVAIYALVQAVR